jgi:hypothetical protein
MKFIAYAFCFFSSAVTVLSPSLATADTIATMMIHPMLLRK